MGVRVFVDADVLFSRTLRDWIFLLRNHAGGGMFTLGSTEDVIAEVVARTRDKRPSATGASISLLRSRLVDNLDELVEDYEVAPWMLERDPGDAHVRAACVGGSFNILLTCDKGLLGDGDTYPNVNYEAIHPDDFLLLVDDSGPAHCRAVAAGQLAYFMERHGEADLAGALRKAGCPRFAERVNTHLHALMS